MQKLPQSLYAYMGRSLDKHTWGAFLDTIKEFPEEIKGESLEYQIFIPFCAQ